MTEFIQSIYSNSYVIASYLSCCVVLACPGLDIKVTEVVSPDAIITARTD
jgi:hypothetical protein